MPVGIGYSQIGFGLIGQNASQINNCSFDHGRLDVDFKLDTVNVFEYLRFRNNQVSQYKIARYSNSNTEKWLALRYRTTQLVINDNLYWRYEALAGVAQKITSRYTSFQNVANDDLVLRFSNIYTQSWLLNRFNSYYPLQKYNNTRYAVMTSTFQQTWHNGNPGGTGLDSGLKPIIYAWNNGQTKSLTGLDLAGNPLFEPDRTIQNGAYELTIRFKESSPAEWQLQILDTVGDLSPENSVGHWYNWLNEKAYNSTNQLVKKMVANITYAGQTFNFVGVPTKAKYQIDWKNNIIKFTWSGTDVSQILYKDIQNFATVKSTLQNIHNSVDLIGQILTTVGLAHDYGSLDSCTIPFMAMQNSKPIEYLTQLFEIFFHEWQVQGELFRVYLPQNKPKEQADWVYDFSSDFVEQVDVDYGSAQVINKVTVSRAKDHSNVAADFEATTFQQYTINFSQPYYGVMWRVLDSNMGIPSDYIFKDSGGNVIAFRSPRVGSTSTYPGFIANSGPINNCTSVTFTFGVNAGLVGVTQGHLHIQFIGCPKDRLSEDAGGGTGSDTNYVVTVQDTNSINQYGIQSIELSPNPLIPDTATMTTHGNRFLARVSRTKMVCRAKVPLNVMLRPGQTIREINEKINRDVAVYVTEVEHVFSDNPERRQTVYTGTTYT